MSENKGILKSTSPRLVGLIVGFMWISYYAKETVTLFMDYLDNLIAQQSNALGLSHYTDELITGISLYDLAAMGVSCIIAIILGIGLVRNHPKNIIAGIVCLMAEGIFYLVQTFLQEDVHYITVLLNLMPVVVCSLILLSLVTFRKGIAKLSLYIITAVELFASVFLFTQAINGVYTDNAFDFLTYILNVFGNSGFDTALLMISLMFYAVVLINYEDEDIQEKYDGEAIESYAYIDMKKHLLLCFFIGPIWYFVWVYRSTKAINELCGEYDKYKPGATTAKHLIPFYSFFWFYNQAERAGDKLIKNGIEEKETGLVSLLLHLIDTFAGMIYLQDKINECCISGKNKLTKKEKYNDYYDENEGITIDYPTDTTEKKPTEIFLDEGQWKECESE